MGFYIGNQKVCPIVTIKDTPTYSYNVNFVGNNIIVENGIARTNGVSTSSYIQTKQPIINQLHTADSWKISIDYSLTYYKQYSTVFATGDANMTSLDYQAINCTYEDNEVKLFLGSDGSSWNIVGWSVDPYDLEDPYMTSACEFILDLEFTGTQYKCSITNLSLGDATPTVTNTETTSTKVGISNNDTPTYLVLANNAFRYNDGYAYGSLIKYNLLNSYYTIDGTTTYLAEEA